MRTIKYETNMGRWPFMTNNWPENQNVKGTDFLAWRLNIVRNPPLQPQPRLPFSPTKTTQILKGV